MAINSNVTINTVSILVNIKLSLRNKKAIPKYSLVLDHYQGETYNLEVLIALTASVIDPHLLAWVSNRLIDNMSLNLDKVNRLCFTKLT
jgi:hypothetical protein